MKKYLLPGFLLTMTAISVVAAPIPKEQLPAKIAAHFAKKHPTATNIVVEEKTHFGQALYEINFKEKKTTKIVEEEDKITESTVEREEAVFYRKNGPFFVSAEKIDSFSIIPGIVTNSIKAAFPDYKIIAAELVINPNGVGEEYEVTITSLGIPWSLSLDKKGTLISKENLLATAASIDAPVAAPVEEKPLAPAP